MVAVFAYSSACSASSLLYIDHTISRCSITHCVVTGDVLALTKNHQHIDKHNSLN